MFIIKSMLFLLKWQHTGNICFSSFSSSILDSGVTNYICSSLTHPTSYIKLIISLSIYQMKIKSLQIILEMFLSIKIDNVWYILNFTFNLLPIANLIDNLHCMIILYSNG